MNLLITGDKGFVGKNLISHLRKKKFKIITLEKKITKKKDVDLKKKKFKFLFIVQELHIRMLIKKKYISITML